MKEQIMLFAEDYLCYLAEKEKTEVPKITWALSMRYERTTKTIWLSLFLVKHWKVNKEATKEVLRYALAHEFAHYLHHVRGLPYHGTWSEQDANKYAEKVTGLSHRRYVGMLKETKERVG